MSYLEKYRLLGEARSLAKDRRFFLWCFVATSVASAVLVVLIGRGSPAVDGRSLMTRLIAAAGANLIFWLFWYGVYRLVVPAVVPYEKLRAFVQRDRQQVR